MIYDRLLIQVRERSFLDLLDVTLLVIRERPMTLGLAALAGIAPFAALNIWLLSGPEFHRVFLIPLLLLETPWATAPLTLVLGDLMFDSPLSVRRYIKSLVISLPALIFTQLILRGILLVTVVGYAIVSWRFAFLDEVILLERLRVHRNEVKLEERHRGFRLLMLRSRDLTAGFEGELLMRWMAQMALGLTFALCFWEGVRSITSTLIGDELTWYRPGLNDVNGHLFQVAVWIAIAFFGVFRFLAYIDRRIRLEGWELKFRLEEAGRLSREKVR